MQPAYALDLMYSVVLGDSWRNISVLGILFLSLQFIPRFLRAERLPTRVYTTADGLASNQVGCIKRDSHGFLWFCTSEGLSRFDGSTFTNYTVEQGLPDRVVTDFLETRDGDYWVATPKGVALFDPSPGSGKRVFSSFDSRGFGYERQVNALFEDHRGTIWLGTINGTAQLVKTGEAWSLRRAAFSAIQTSSIEEFLEDPDGSLWFAAYDHERDSRLCKIGAGGKYEEFRNRFFKNNRILTMLRDRRGRFWVGTYHGLALVSSNPAGDRQIVDRVYGIRDGLGSEEVSKIYESSDGQLWVTAGGVFVIKDSGAKGQIRFERFAREGQTGGIEAEDTQGNFWGGRTRIARGGWTSYGREDGFIDENIRSVFEANGGQLYVVSGYHNRFLARFDGNRFSSVVPRAQGHEGAWDWGGWGWGQIHLQDHQGEWWMATGHGLVRFPRVEHFEQLAHTDPKAVYTAGDGLGGNDVFRLYEDRRGDIWISDWGSLAPIRWDRSTERFHAYSTAEGWTAGEVTAFAEDTAGDLWLGEWGGQLARYRNGRFVFFNAAADLPKGSVLAIAPDHAGRLWVATTHGGLLRVDDPAAEAPHFRFYTTHDGLSSNDVRAIAVDQANRIYFWTGRGVDRLEPETGAIRQYTEHDGLVPAGSDHNVAFCDRHGDLWFGLQGLSRLTPTADSVDSTLPPVRITRIRVHGRQIPTSELGESNVNGLKIPPNQDDIQIEFATISFGLGDVIRFQYRLDGADTDWSVPSPLRVVDYPHLSSGSYRFMVRAMNADGRLSPNVAAVSFQMLSPFWRSWWFLSSMALLAVGLTYWAYSLRVERLLYLERVRTRIATDLHDDIGSSLTQIAVMSEAAQRARDDAQAKEPLARIAELSRELIDNFSDIVWAINPQRDTLGDLTHRMRRFASDIFTSSGVPFVFRAPAEGIGISLPADFRREMFLVFKESVNNIARHSGCSSAEVVLELDGSRLTLTVSDNGVGFEKTQNGTEPGHGLASMAERARRLGGDLTISSSPGAGARVTLRARIK